jgi:hypothetical protein
MALGRQMMQLGPSLLFPLAHIVQNSKIHSLMQLRLKQLNNAFSCGSGSASAAMVFTP